ncbi:MAG: transporter substrate-binding domain-containing protein [Clostridia bacterium]|nr:transporter substrate-binding domain-containing protein [Clostridia bacterium]
MTKEKSKRTKRIIFISVAVVLALIVGGVAYFFVWYNSTDDDSLNEVKKRGVLRVGILADDIVTDEVILSNEGDNMDTLIAQRLAKDLGVELEIKRLSLEEGLANLLLDFIDCFISFSINTINPGDYDISYSIPFIKNDAVLVTRDIGRELKIDRIDANIKVGYIQVEGTYFNELVKTYQNKYLMSHFECYGYKNFGSMYGALAAGEIDALIDGQAYFKYRSKGAPDLVTVDYTNGKNFSFGQTSWGILFDKVDILLKDYVNEELTKMAKEGYLSKLSKAAFGEDLVNVALDYTGALNEKKSSSKEEESSSKSSSSSKKSSKSSSSSSSSKSSYSESSSKSSSSKSSSSKSSSSKSESSSSNSESSKSSSDSSENTVSD